MALTFVDRWQKVVVLESGSLEFDRDTQDLYEGEVVGRPYHALDATRLRFFGGSTNHWGGMSAPLDPGDFAPRPWVPLSGWPIGRDDLEPFYRRAQRVLDLGPFDYDPEALSPDRLARLTPELLVSRVFRFSTPPTPLGEKYRDTLRLAANVTVFLNANLVDIESAGQGAPARAFVARSLAGRHVRVAARAFVLALGGIENARLLLNADRTANGGIGNQYDLVGRYFMEHPGAMIGRMLLQQQGWEGA